MSFIKLGVLISIFHVMSCTHNKGPSTSTSETKMISWSSEMKSIEDQMIFLIDKTSNVERFRLAKAEKQELNKIKHSFEILKKKAMSLEDRKLQPDRDPSLAISARIFRNNVDLAADSFLTENYEFSKSTLRSALGQCVQCHTRLEYGPQFQKEKWTQKIEDTDLIDQIQLFIATRNFKLAQKKIDEALVSEPSLSSPFLWQDIVQLGFLLNVRFNNDPMKTAQMINAIESSKQIPMFIKRNVPFWRDSLAGWRSLQTETNKLKLSDRLIKKGDELNTASRSEGGLIYYLLATRVLQEDIAFNQSDKKANAEILYRLGLINTLVNDNTSESMYEDYFELCIKDAPHTLLAKKCYSHLERNLTQQYTGRMEQNLPFDIKARLNELSKLAL